MNTITICSYILEHNINIYPSEESCQSTGKPQTTQKLPTSMSKFRNHDCCVSVHKRKYRILYLDKLKLPKTGTLPHTTLVMA